MTKPAVYAARKLKSRRGESLVETLVAILISVLAMALLASLIVIASKMTRESTISFNKYYEANNKVTAFDSEKKLGKGTVSFTSVGGTDCFISENHDASITVEYFQNTEAGNTDVISYQRVTG